MQAGAISPAHVVDGDVVVRNVSRSNGVFALAAGDRDLVVKGPALLDPDAEARLACERRFYALAAGDPDLVRAAPIPALVAEPDDVLVLERVRPGETLEDRARERGVLPGDAALLGSALGAWRRVSGRLAALELAGRLPWVLEALGPAPPDAVVRSVGAARLAAVLRREPVLADGLAGLRAGWRRDAIVHGDVRWDNALVDEDERSGRERVVLVDWEFLGVGDAGWDVAGALADVIALAAAPEPAAPGPNGYRPAPAGELVRLSRQVAEPVEAFRSAYRAAAPTELAEADLEAGVRLLPARVLQIAFLHAAWGLEEGLGSALQLAGVAGAMLGETGGRAQAGARSA
ncbi:MAG TPA: aminoglycoside phosphotransferase family protein [Gaiellaceae bacterium]|nr:aminoglycoside phosphotransferase family protein [Gaiellaceae bacterium]